MPNADPNLARGPQVRVERADLKKAMRADVELALEVIAGTASERHEEVAAAMPIESLLLVVPGIGSKFVSHTLDHRRIPPTARTFGLTAERRAELVARIREELNR